VELRARKSHAYCGIRRSNRISVNSGSCRNSSCTRIAHEKGAIPGFRPGMTPAGSEKVWLGAAPSASRAIGIPQGGRQDEFAESACDAEPAHLPLVNALHVHGPAFRLKCWYSGCFDDGYHGSTR